MAFEDFFDEVKFDYSYITLDIKIGYRSIKELNLNLEVLMGHGSFFLSSVPNN